MMNSNPMAALMQAIRSGQNPMAVFQSMAGQNPRVAQALHMIQGKNPRQLRAMAENMAQERGINLQEMARQLGLK